MIDCNEESIWAINSSNCWTAITSISLEFVIIFPYNQTSSLGQYLDQFWWEDMYWCLRCWVVIVLSAVQCCGDRNWLCYAVGLRGVHSFSEQILSYYKYAKSFAKTTAELLFGRLFDLKQQLRWHKRPELATDSMIPILHNPIRSLWSSAASCVRQVVAQVAESSSAPEALLI